MRPSTRLQPEKRIRRASVAFLCALASIFAGSAVANAQSSPGAKTAEALPFIVIVTDTSSSMEFTSRGDITFPELNGKSFDPTDPHQLRLIKIDTTQTPPVYYADVLTPNEPPTAPGAFIGPCAVWEPNSCTLYERPTHYFQQNTYGPPIGTNNSTWANMTNRMKYARDHLDYRLTDNNQPKHVTVKEILTGDMIFTPSTPGIDPEQLSPEDYGPGCWLVPRQNLSKNAPEIQNYCQTRGNFTRYVDSDDAVPHFQEVYNYQKKNGLLDTLARSAIFAFSGLDGYPDEKENDPYKEFPNYPTSRGVIREDTKCSTDRDCYNLGVRKIVAPKTLRDLSLSDLAHASDYTQLAIRDTGFLSKPHYHAEVFTTPNPPSKQVYRFDSGDDRFLANLTVGDQPIARATPLAAAVYDVYNYFTLSEVDKRYPLNAANDPYTTCRDRQVILISDGSPEPERPSPSINVTIGSRTLSATFGYDPNFFPYLTSEAEIAYLHQYRPSAGNAVKVHVVALLSDLTKTLTPAELSERQERLRKLDLMAASGGTCASLSLGPDWISTTSNPRECPRNGGPGNDLGRACLDTTPRGDYGPSGAPNYEITDPETGAPLRCRYPALVLTKNTRADLEAAIAITLNDILAQSGIRSRTRTVYSDDLQSVVTCGSSSIKATGVNEFLSGMKASGSPFWSGLLYRNTYACGCDVKMACSADPAAQKKPVVTDLSKQISDQVERNGNTFKDNRRIFTTLLSTDLFDYQNFGLGSTYKLPLSSQTRFFRSWVPFIPSAGTGYAGSTFGSARHPGSTYPGTSGMQIEMESRFLGQSGVFGNFSRPAQYRESVARLIGLSSNASIGKVNSIFDQFRGRTAERIGRTLAGIYNGNPVTLDPPSLNVPIESYRIYKNRMANRPPIVFVPTIDGLLHAVYGGKGEILNNGGGEGVILHRTMRSADQSINNGAGGQEVIDGGSSQREAWAYIPFFLLPQLSNSQNSNPYLLDGTPVVKDVRLCNSIAKYNYNQDVCGRNDVLPADQWRTVLIQGLGLAGRGYYALDVTYEGGNADPSNINAISLPDPIPLWEFSPADEKVQASYLTNKRGTNLIGSKINPCLGISPDQAWNDTLMGNSISDPDIGTLLVDAADGAGRIQRPVAFFGGGEGIPGANPACSITSSGKAIYLVDIQTGSLLRRFVSYKRGKSEHLFPDALTGSPVFYNNFTGTVATRGYIGDAAGRLYKIDLSSSDPEDWTVYLFFDPANAPRWLPKKLNQKFGPANYRPAITKLPDENLLVVYGLGEVGDRISPTTVQAIIGLRDRLDLDPADLPVRWNKDPQKNDLLWRFIFAPGEKLTGAPFIYDNVTYFPTYKAPDASNLCLPGDPQINRVYDEPNKGWIKATTNFQGSDNQTIIRGLSLRTNPCCSGSLSPPELVAQTGGASLNELQTTITDQGGNSSPQPTSGQGAQDPRYAGRSDSSGELSTFRQNIKNPVSQSIPISWTRVIN